MKTKILIISTLLLVALVYGLFKYNQPVAKTGNRDADFKMTSVELFEDFESNEQLASEMYLDKVVEVCGSVSSTSTEADGSIGIVLNGGGMLFGVSCRFETQEKESVSSISEGNEICVKGVCTGMLSDVVLNRCILINVSN